MFVSNKRFKDLEAAQAALVASVQSTMEQYTNTSNAFVDFKKESAKGRREVMKDLVSLQLSVSELSQWYEATLEKFKLFQQEIYPEAYKKAASDLSEALKVVSLEETSEGTEVTLSVPIGDIEKVFKRTLKGKSERLYW